MIALDKRNVNFIAGPPEYVPEVPAGVPPQDAATWAGRWLEVLPEHLLGFLA
jgi:hypothetical protein